MNEGIVFLSCLAGLIIYICGHLHGENTGENIPALIGLVCGTVLVFLVGGLVLSVLVLATESIRSL